MNLPPSSLARSGWAVLLSTALAIVSSPVASGVGAASSVTAATSRSDAWWTGSIRTSWNARVEGPGTQTVTYSGRADYEGISLFVPNDYFPSRYTVKTATIVEDSTEVTTSDRDPVRTCTSHRHGSVSGPLDARGTDIWLELADGKYVQDNFGVDGVYFKAFDAALNWTGGYECTDGTGGSSSGVGNGVEGVFSSQERVFVNDTDPQDPDHLIGTMTLGMDDLPGCGGESGCVNLLTAYTYAVSYDLRRTLSFPTNPDPPRPRPDDSSPWRWSVQDRMVDADEDGILDSPYIGGNLSSALVPNQTLNVDLNACPASPVTWVVDGIPLGTGCQVRVQMTEGQHQVTAKTPDGDLTHTINPQHYVVVGLGDSYGSGEGVPAKDGWDNKACHRSRNSSQAQAAQALEHADDKSAVTFVHLACSGAVTGGLFGKQKSPPGGGKAVSPQIATAARLTEGNDVDAVLLSLGGNDVHFSDIITNCAAYGKCPTSKKRLKSTAGALACSIPAVYALPVGALVGCFKKTKKVSLELHDEVQGYLKVLPGSLAKVADCLYGGRHRTVPLSSGSRRSTSTKKQNVLHTEYPALGQDERGNFCDRELIALGSGIADEEFRWATEVVQWGKPGEVHRPNYNAGRDPDLKVRYNGLNQVILDAGPRGWTPVAGLFDASRKHGYCAKASYVTSLTTSAKNQKDQFGAFHPNYKGQAVFGRIIAKEFDSRRCSDDRIGKLSGKHAILRVGLTLRFVFAAVVTIVSRSEGTARRAALTSRRHPPPPRPDRLARGRSGGRAGPKRRRAAPGALPQAPKVPPP